MTNILKTINSFIKSNIDGVTIYNDLFPKDDTNGVIAIHDPATRVVNRFIDGTAIYSLNVSYNARYPKANEARSILDSILTLLDGQKLSDSLDDLELKLSASANVQFYGTDDKGRSLYTCAVNVEYKTF